VRECELFEFLKNQRQSGNNKYFTVEDIRKYANEKGFNGIENIRKQLRKLHRFGYIEVEALPYPN